MIAPTSKFDGAAPPGPIDTYIRMPTRLASLTPPDPDVDTSAQMTAWRSPDEASLGTRIVTVSNAVLPGARRSTARLGDVQLESSFPVWPAANANPPWRKLAAAG
jgi:hypothetical protein